jgi:hypothetical protein
MPTEDDIIEQKAAEEKLASHVAVAQRTRTRGGVGILKNVFVSLSNSSPAFF